jgi:hypothetical protein
MSKAIISLKINRINSFSGVDSISSISLLVNRLGEKSSMEFKKIIVLHDNYVIAKEKLSEVKNHIEEFSNSESQDIERIHPENLKNYLDSILSDLEEIYLVSGFSDFEEQMLSIESLFYLFGSYKLNLFNTLDFQDKDSDFLFCQSNLKKFFSYISQK